MKPWMAVPVVAALAAAPAQAAGRGDLSASQAVLLVVGIVGVQALLWIPLLIWLRRRSAAAVESIRRTAENARERLVLGPESVHYARALGRRVGTMHGHAVIALTAERLIVKPLLGAESEIRLSEVAEVSEGKWFRGSYRNGRTQVILKLRDGAAVAFIAGEPERWVAALSLAAGGRGRH